MPDISEKRELLKKKLHEIDKKYGKGTAMFMNDSSVGNVKMFSTGLVAVDNILGGGLPRGRVIEIYGPESSGKTTLALQAIASIQNQENGLVAFIDPEHALDPVYAEKLGVHIDDMVISQPDNGEQAIDVAADLISSGAVDLIVIDSVAALVPKAEIEGEMEDNFVGLHARLMSKSLRKLTAIASKMDCTVIFINQLREKVGVMYGNPEVTTGGRALKFYSSVRIEVRKTEATKEGSEVVGAKTKIKVVKNKVAPPFKETIIEVRFGEGFDRVLSLIDFAVERGVIEKSGSWFSYNGNRLGQGRNAVADFLKNNPDEFKEIEDKLRKVNVEPSTPEVDEDDENPLNFEDVDA